MKHYEVLIVGGGFYGCEIALKLSKIGLSKILLVEKENELMKRASVNNQARVHNGYHYPRSIKTAQSSSKNYQKFINDYAYSIYNEMTMLYAIRKYNYVEIGICRYTNDTQYD